MFNRLLSRFHKPKPTDVVTAEGDAATAVGQQGVSVRGNSFGNINTGLQLTISLFAKQAASHGLEPDKDALADKLSAYLEQLRLNYKTIPLVSYDPEDRVMKPISIDAAYVQSNLEPVSEDLDADSDADLIERLKNLQNSVPSDHALMFERNLVVTGEAGQGKTIALIRLAWLLAEAHLADTTTAADNLMLSRGNLPIPVYLPLAVCAHDLKSRPLSQQSLAGYLDEYTQRDGLLPTEHFFSTLVALDRPMLLMLDGLDEIVDEAERESLCERIVRLTDNKHNVRVVLAARTSAYRGTVRSQCRGSFTHFKLAAFDSAQIKNLCDRAYDALFPKINQFKQAQARSESLQRSIAQLEARRKEQFGPQAPALIDSPLMVRLAMIVHSYAGALPEQRAELLMKAVEAQLRADYAPEAGERKIVSQLAGGWETHRDLLRAAALAMHQRQRTELNEREIKAAMQALPGAAAFSDEALHFARTRSGVLQAEGVGQYRFVHLALQQSLAACHLCVTQTPVQAATFLADQDRITQAWWREVAFLVAGYFVAPTNPDRDPTRLAEFVQALAAQGQRMGHAPATRFACIDVAAQCAKDHVAEGDPLRTELAQTVAALMDDDTAAMQAGPVFARLQLGDLLTQFGDPRLHVTTVDVMRFCYVPPGPFLMGSDDSDPQAEADEKCTDATWNQKGFDIPYGYWLGQHPISNAQFGEFIDDHGYDNKEWWTLAIAAGVWQAGKLKKRYLTTSASNRTREEQDRAFKEKRVTEAEIIEAARPDLLDAIRRKPNHSAAYINWYEAQAFCAWLRSRWRKYGVSVQLPNEPEWEKAARGGIEIPTRDHIADVNTLHGLDLSAGDTSLNPIPRRIYPWGNLFDTGRANTLELTESLGRDINKEAWTSPLGCFAQAQSVYGCRDMSGNVAEWTRSLCGPSPSLKQTATLRYAYPYVSEDGRENLNADTTMTRVLRGGAWLSYRGYARCAYRNRNEPDLGFSYIGFRVMLLPLSSSRSSTPVL